MVMASMPDGAEFSFVPFSRRRLHRRQGDSGAWAPKWRKLVAGTGECGIGGSVGPPGDFEEFDRVVRGMLNRISTENARFLLPLDPGLRGADAGDCAPWWAARCAALMLNHYLQVIHTSRCARGLAMRSNDNVLPEYLDAVAPLLARSPQLVHQLVAWVAHLLHWNELCWPNARLVLLAAREPRERSALPGHSLGRLPPELVRGRILSFLVPPALPRSAASQEVSLPASLCACWGDPDGKKDVVAVLAHLLLFSPAAAWPQLSSCALAIAEAAVQGPARAEEEKVYLAAAVVVSVAQRIERSLSRPPQRQAMDRSQGEGSWEPPPVHLSASSLRQDLACLLRLERLLAGAAECAKRPPASGLSPFVNSRVLAASEHALRVVKLAESCLE
eukprot:TRINITY_DN58797_c0_g1_i1.p1 TRINITY_DN58797_c0_g1~~TRINITY_DN58797_c0_g1_i1.p1  ORF type:complete len:405 (+),score=61.51 TRINITY_DN58797_c0_g1_i1:50-1216(+)